MNPLLRYQSREKIGRLINQRVESFGVARLDPLYDIYPLIDAFISHFYPGMGEGDYIVRVLKNTPEFADEWLMNWLIENGYGR